MTSTAIRHNGVAIRAFRVKAGLRPGEFAAAVRLSYPHLDNIENERKQASLEVLHRIAGELGVPVGALLRDPSVLTAGKTVAVA